MRKYIFLIVTLFFINCSGRIQKIVVSQEGKLPVDITFYVRDSVRKSTLILKNKMIIHNPNPQSIDINFHYFRDGDTILFPNQVMLTTVTDEDYLKRTGKANRIRLNPFERREFSYFVWNTLNNIDLIKSENLRMYMSLSKPFREYDKIFKIYREDKNILSYEEPFSEFKRKNPELLEFLTKGDSIELEVISPVKQKYKFKAEW